MERFMETVRLDIQGMSCDHCVRAVREALAGVDGAQVESVEIGSATVTYDPARTSSEAIANAVSDEGYEAVRSD